MTTTLTLMEFLSRHLEEQHRDITFLEWWGWKRIDGATIEHEGVKSNCVWEHPQTGKRYAQIASFCKGWWRRAIDVANEEHLEYAGWKEIRVRIHRAGPNEELINTKEQSFYVHPDTKRLFPLEKAIELVRDYYNKEEYMCALTGTLNELVDGNRLNEGDLVCLDFENGIYEMWE